MTAARHQAPIVGNCPGILEAMGDDRHVAADLKVLLKRVDLPTLGERIKRARLAVGLTQTELAGPDASVAYISRIESGQRRPDYDLLAALASRLDVTLEELLLGVTSDALAADRLQLDYADLALKSDDPQRAVSLAQDLLARHSAAPDRQFLERVRLTHAAALEATGDLEGALDALEAIQRDETSTPSARLRAAISLSRCYRESGDLNRAIAVGESVLDGIADSDLARTDEALQLVATVAAAHFSRGDVTYAARLCRRAIEVADEASSPGARAAIYWNASIMQSERGDAAGALPLAEKALALLAETDHLASINRLRAQLAVIQLELDPPALTEAAAGLERAAAEFEALGGSAVDRARTVFYLAKVRFLEGDLGGARALADQALGAATDLAPRLAADCLTLLGQVAMAEGHADGAREHYQRAVLTLAAAGDSMDRQTAQLWLDLAGLLESVGMAAEALDAYRRSAASTGMRPSHARTSTRAF